MKAILPFLAAAAALVAPAYSQDANEMIRQVRLSATVQKTDLYGSVRNGKKGNKVPLALFLREGNMQFKLEGLDAFHIRMGDEKAELMTVAADHTPTPFPASKLNSVIPGTDLTFEDLTMRFLYWENAKLEGEVKINDADCYKIRLDNPSKTGAYSAVYVFLHKKYGALWDIQAYDKGSNLLKEFSVGAVMQLKDGSYTVKQMRVDANKGAGVTFIEFDAPQTAKPPKALPK